MDGTGEKSATKWTGVTLGVLKITQTKGMNAIMTRHDEAIKRIKERNTSPDLKDVRIVDITTGEMVEGYGLNIPQSDASKLTYNALFRSHGESFYWAIIDDATTSHQTTESDAGKLIYLMTYASYPESDGKIFLQHDNGNRIDRKSLENVMGLSKRTLATFLNGIRKAGFISYVPKSDGGGFEVNTDFTFKGAGIESHIPKDKRYIRAFIEQIRSIYKQLPTAQHRYLGMIYKLLPYVHHDLNMITHNPTEPSERLIQIIQMKELADMMGYEKPRDLKMQMKRIRINDRPLFKFITNNDYSDEFIVVNPYIVYGGNQVKMSAIRVMFDV